MPDEGKRAEIIAHLTIGIRLFDALDLADVTYADYRDARDTDLDFAANIDRARHDHFRSLRVITGRKAGRFS